jgi:hypothetical protein
MASILAWLLGLSLFLQAIKHIDAWRERTSIETIVDLLAMITTVTRFTTAILSFTFFRKSRDQRQTVYPPRLPQAQEVNEHDKVQEEDLEAGSKNQSHSVPALHDMQNEDSAELPGFAPRPVLGMPAMDSYRRGLVDLRLQVASGVPVQAIATPESNAQLQTQAKFCRYAEQLEQRLQQMRDSSVNPPNYTPAQGATRAVRSRVVRPQSAAPQTALIKSIDGSVDGVPIFARRPLSSIPSNRSTEFPKISPNRLLGAVARSVDLAAQPVTPSISNHLYTSQEVGGAGSYSVELDSLVPTGAGSNYSASVDDSLASLFDEVALSESEADPVEPSRT